jgi:hypothetical protein
MTSTDELRLLRLECSARDERILFLDRRWLKANEALVVLSSPDVDCGDSFSTIAKAEMRLNQFNTALRTHSTC